MQEEKIIQKKIVKAIGTRPDIRVFPNDVGMGYHGSIRRLSGLKVLTNPQPFRYGLQVGVSDIIGFKETIITPDMVGSKVAVFLALEVKTKTGKPTDEQINFLNTVANFGGICGIVRSAKEAINIVSMRWP